MNRIKVTSIKISRIYFCNDGHEGWSSTKTDVCEACGGTAKDTGEFNEAMR